VSWTFCVPIGRRGRSQRTTADRRWSDVPGMMSRVAAAGSELDARSKV
jgi:hypothetical protein